MLLVLGRVHTGCKTTGPRSRPTGHGPTLISQEATQRCAAQTTAFAAGKASTGRLDEHVADAVEQTLHLLRALGHRSRRQQQARRRQREDGSRRLSRRERDDVSSVTCGFMTRLYGSASGSRQTAPALRLSAVKAKWCSTTTAGHTTWEDHGTNNSRTISSVSATLPTADRGER